MVLSNGNMYILGGNGNNALYNDVWRSQDGKVWSKVETVGSNLAQWPARKDFCAVVIKDYIWMIAGLGEHRRKLKDV